MASVAWGRTALAKGLHGWGRQAMLLLNHTMEFALKLWKSMENLSA
jgi:hypothetical protein